MSTTAIVSSSDKIQKHPVAQVWVADALREADFTSVPFLRVEQLRVVCGPEIDTCQLSYEYGDIIREHTVSSSSSSSSSSFTPTLTYYPPLELTGKFIKIQIPDLVYAADYAADSGTTTPNLPITWYGRIEHDARDTDGSGVTVTSSSSSSSSSSSTTVHARGTQTLTAFGLLRLLEQEVVDTSYVDLTGTSASSSSSSSDTIIEVYTGLPFNVDPDGQFIRRGNRSAVKTGGSYVFSWEPRGQDNWTAYDAVEYLLTYQTPIDGDGNTANTWRLSADAHSLDWYDIDLETNGKTVKHLIDELIPRQRAVGYYVNFDNSNDQIVLHAFTFSNVAITLPGGQTLEANTHQFSLNFETALDITEAVVSETAITRYHRVIARGERRTNTLTAKIGTAPSATTILHPGWTSTDEMDYVTGTNIGSDITGVTVDQKLKRFAIYRSSPKLENVFRRYKLNQENGANRWNGSIPDPLGNVSTLYALRGAQAVASYNSTYYSTTLNSDYVPALRIRRALPLYETTDWSGTALTNFNYVSFSANVQPSFMRPFVFAQTGTTTTVSSSSSSSSTITTKRYEMLDKLHRSWTAAGDRTWSCSIGILDTEPGLEIHAHPPHFLSGSGYTTPNGVTFDGTTLSPNEDHTLQKGIDYSTCFATFCVELTEHVQAEVVLQEPPTHAPEQTLIINVPGARFDYITPYTVVDIQDGVPIQTTSGGFAKNDYPRLQNIATAAAQWYSQERQTLELAYRQIRGLFTLGWLITDVGADYNEPISSSSSSSSSSSNYGPKTAINTPITGITYDLGRGSTPGYTRLETGFVNLDFSDMGPKS